MPAWASNCPSSRPAGPAPMIATWVRMTRILARRVDCGHGHIVASFGRYTTPMTLLTLRDAELAYGDFPLLDHAQLSVQDGERIGLIGRNGTGKSTLLKVVTGAATLD